MSLSFVYTEYKGCRISARGVYSPENRCWVPRALVRWTGSSESHIAKLRASAECFNTRKDAEDYAVALAYRWCDEHILEKVASSEREQGGFRGQKLEVENRYERSDPRIQRKRISERSDSDLRCLPSDVRL